ncbi:hypothetical protein [Planosporangium mesophilum]|nr:hypothetical protein [Planosporangium mesophilum]NJC83863.1 hypothetical protein [Planosporangium mesophilum]
MVTALVCTALAGCGHFAAEQPAYDATAQGRADADQHAREAADQIERHSVYRAPDYLHAASQIKGVDVMSVHGTYRNADDGVTLVIRVHGRAPKMGRDKHADGWVDVPVCYRLVWNRDPGQTVRGSVACPGNAPINTPVDPALPGDTDQTLQTALASTPVDEAKVRAAVAALTLPSGIVRDVTAYSGGVAVALHGGRYDCVMALRTPTGVRVWRPQSVQLEPGEGGCAAQQATSEYMQHPPH